MSDLKPNQEIERKFLLDRLPPEAVELGKWALTETGYLPGALDFRVQHKRLPNGQQSYKRCLKLGEMPNRQEFEERLSAEQFATYWPLTEGRRTCKLRYRVPCADLVLEIDVFLGLGAPLVLAEVELPYLEYPLDSLPSWFRSRVVREVTEDPSYLNRNIAR